VSSKLIRRLLTALGAALALYVCSAVATLRSGRAELAASDGALERKELESAVNHARAAALALVPGAAHVDAAYARLRSIALAAEHDQHAEVAVLAWRALRMAAVASQHVWQPRLREIAEADAGLARSLASTGNPADAAVAAPRAR
jgi:hypothetical protein